MPPRKKPSSAADVLRKEMEQPLVLPNKPDNNNNDIKPSADNKTMTSANDDAQLQAAQKEIAELKSKLEHQAKEAQKMEKDLKETKETALKLAEQNKETAKSRSTLAIVKKSKGEGRDNPSLTARPVETREETARRRANTDIGWLD